MSTRTINDLESIAEIKAREIVINELSELNINYKVVSHKDLSILIRKRKELLLQDSRSTVVIGALGTALMLIGGI